MKISVLAFALALAVPFCTMAQGATNNAAAAGPHRPPAGPPPEALQACAGKAAQAACGFTDRGDHAVSGVCEVDTHNATATPSSALVCRPACGPPPNSGGPPPTQGASR